MHTRECERRLTLRIQVGGRDRDTCVRACAEKDVEVRPNSPLLTKYVVRVGVYPQMGLGLVWGSEVSVLALLYARGATYTRT